jgi:hypothetical protein
VSESGGKKKKMFSQGTKTYNTDSPFPGLTMLACVLQFCAAADRISTGEQRVATLSCSCTKKMLTVFL